MSRVIFILLTCCITATLPINAEFSEAYCNFTVESNNYTCNDDASCPTWFYCNTETSRSLCGEGYQGMIACDEATGRAAVSNCHCVTYDKVTKKTQVGSCYYNCENTPHKTLYDRVYHLLPKNPTESNLILKVVGNLIERGHCVVSVHLGSVLSSFHTI